MKNKILLLLVLTLIFALTACANTEDESPLNQDSSEGPSDSSNTSQLVTYGVAGYIKELTVNDDFGTILVEGELGKNGADYDKAYVRIDSDTVIFFNDQGRFEDFEVGQYVEVFFEGPVAESYPVQGSARQVNIVDPPVFIDDPTESE